MTLCAAWIRHNKQDEDKELVFATDSRLHAGEAWDTGIKLFDLGRSDCLLCFAGTTRRAYPLLLQGTQVGRFDPKWSDPRIDVHDLLDHLLDLFTNICHTLTSLPSNTTRAEKITEEPFAFMFGGWSWRTQEFGIWRLAYSKELDRMVSSSQVPPEKARVVAFLGNPDEYETAAWELYRQMAFDRGTFDELLDMEPMEVTSRMAADPKFPYIGGALQIGKVYRSGLNEIFGVHCPSFPNGDPCLFGRKVRTFDTPNIRFLDQETAVIVDDLPLQLDLTDSDFGTDSEFIAKCYGGPGNTLQNNLTDQNKSLLARILRERAYRIFLSDLNRNNEV